LSGAGAQVQRGATVDDYFSFGERRGRAARLPQLIKQPSDKHVAAIFPSGGDAEWPRQATRRLGSRAPAWTVDLKIYPMQLKC